MYLKKILILGIITLSLKVSATDYYLSSEGNDSNNGTSSSSPWRTLERLNSAFSGMNPGDRIFFRRGDTFYGTLKVTASGNSGSHIIIGAYGSGNKPVISGFRCITSWNYEGNGIYSKDFGCESDLNMVRINGTQYGMGRYPNSGWLTYESSSGTSSITDYQLDESINWVDAEAVIKKNPYALDRCLITSQSGKTLYYSSLGSSGYPTNGFGYFFQKHFRTLDSFGEWYYNGTTLYVYFGSSNPDNYVVEASYINNLINIEGRNYITIDNLSLIGANNIAINLRVTTNIRITNCEIDFSGNLGIYNLAGGTANVTIDNNHINHSNTAAINSVGQYVTITNNLIENTGLIPGTAVGESGLAYTAIYMYSCSYGDVQYNRIINTGYNGINARSTGTRINYNYIDNFCIMLQDGGGIYTGTTDKDREIKGNIILNGIGNNSGTTLSYLDANGIYLDEPTGYISVTDNTVAFCSNSGIKLHEAHDINIAGNNTVGNSNQIEFFGSGFQPSHPIRNIEMYNNTFISKEKNQLVLKFESVLDDIKLFGTSDYNYFARPVDDNLTFKVDEKSSIPNVLKNLAGWQSYTGQDANSKKSPVSVDDPNKIRLVYNDSKESKQLYLDRSYIDVQRVKYSGNITLPPFSSLILIEDPDPSAPPPSPVYVSSSVNHSTPSVIELTYNMTLANIIPDKSAFSVHVNSTPRNISSVSISGVKVLINLSSPIVYRDVVTIAYTRPSSNPIQSTQGSQAASFTAQPVTNNVYPPSPEYISSVIENATPSILEMNYSLPLASNIIPATSSFTVRVNSNSRSVSSITVSGTKVLLTLASPVNYGDQVTIAYSRPSSNPLQSTEGGWASSLSAQEVTNNVKPSVPVYSSSVIAHATPSIIEITFTQNLSSSSVPPASAFQVMVNSSARNVTGVSVSGTKVNLTLSSAVAYGDAVTVAYTKPSTGALTSTSGAEVASFSARNVTNNVLSPIPAYISSVIENASPTRLEMTYSLTLANSVPATSAFSVRVNSNARSVTSVSISGSKVILTLASAVVYGDVVTVSYTKPSVNPIKTPEGAEASSITSQPVTNRVSPVLPVYVSSVIENATPDKLEITFSLTLANSVPPVSAFNVQVNSAARTVNSVAVSGTKVILTLSSPVAYGNTVTVAYTKPSSNPVKTASGGEAASFTAQTVKNNVLYVNNPPVVVVKYATSNLSGLVAEINASGTYDVDKDNLTYQWIVPENIPVSSTTSSRIKFLSPVVSESKTYQFVLKVSDGKNVETKNVPVKVNPYKPELMTAEVTKVEASSYSYPNFPFNIIDGNIGTMWAAEGDGEWLLLYLSEPFMVDHVKLAFQQGQKSESYFDILGSPDGETWEPILDKSNSCAFSGNLQVFGFPPAKTETAYSFIKLIGHSNAANNWNYISEFQVFGRYVRENRNKDLGQVVIYPNPARDLVNVMIRETPLPPDLLRIVSMAGRVMYETKIEPDIKEFQIPVNLINGLYIIQLESGTVTVSAQKLIINN